MRSYSKKVSLCFALPFFLVSLMVAQSPTTTTLTVSPANYVNPGTVVTLTATVTNPGYVTAGTVNFCNASSTDCSPGSGLYGTAQLTSAGTATIHRAFGYGVNNINAVFLPTNSNAGSTSITNFVTVGTNQVYVSATTLGSAGSPGNYTLSGNVTAFGNEPLTGESVNFLDTTSSNSQIGTTTLGTAAPVFSALKLYGAGSYPYDIALGDFDNDGKPDIVVSEQAGLDMVEVLLGNGDGTFSTAVPYSAGHNTFYCTVGDFNGDGNLDIAVSNHSDNTISIFLGNGDGTFRSQLVSAAGLTPAEMAVGDFNKDGKLDIVVMNDEETTFSILHGNGDGTFQSPVAYASGTNPAYPDGSSSNFAVGDFNHDGNLDLAISNSSNNTVSIVLGNGDGTFRAPVTYSVGTWPMQIATADFNGDGNLDIAVANATSPGTVSVLLGHGDGTFQSPVTDPSEAYSGAVVVGDFNGDGKLDLAVDGAILYGNGDGTFRAPTAVSTGGVFAAADLNGDGRLDLVNMGSATLNEQVASYSQGSILVPGTGTHYVLASFPGNAANLTSQSPTVPLTATGLEAQTITFAPIPSPVTIGVAPTALSAAGGGSGNPIIFTVLSGPGSISGNVLTVTGVGTIVVAANQAGNADYSAAPQVTQSVVVNAITPTFSVSCSPSPVVYGANTTCTAVVSGGATGTVSFYSNGSLWASPALSNGTASATGFAGQVPGTYSVTASYSGDSDNNPASTGTTLTITQAPQSITFAQPASPVTYGVSPISLSASASSGLAVSFGVLSGPATVSGNILTITGAGTVVVAANQPGNVDYSAAPQVAATIVVNKATPTLTWSTPASITYGTALSAAQLDATSGGVAGTFAYSPTSGAVLGAGNQVLSVTFTPTDSVDYSNQTASVNLTVNQATAGVNVSCAPNSITYGSQTTNCTTTVGGSATGSVVWTINGGAWTTTGLSGGVTSAGGFAGWSAGSYTIGVTYGGDTNYAPAGASTTLTIQKANPPLNWISPANISYGTPLSATQLDPTSGGVAGTFAFSPPVGTVLPVGSHNLSATFTPTDSTDYNQLTIITTLVVAATAPSISVNCAPNPITYGPQTSTCTAALSAGATGSVAFFYNGTNWANVPLSGGQASATGFSNMSVGSYTIVANYSGDSNFNPASNFTTLTIGPASPTVSLSCYPTSFALGSTTTCTASVPTSDGTVAFYSAADLTGKWWNSPYPAGGGDLGTTPVATTQDGSLNYNIMGYPWPNATAAPAGVDTTNIYARWTGTFVSPVDGAYTIGVNSDDGANVYVNGTLLVGNLTTGQGAQSNLTYTQSGQISLSAGATNTIIVEYQQGSGGAGIQLLWTPPGASSASLLGWTVVPVDADGIASINGGSPWSAGTYNVTAVYSGDANYSAMTSNVVPVTVTQATPTVTVACSPNSIVYGTTTSCTAHVSAGAGTVSFTGGPSQPGPWVETVDGSGDAVLTGFSNWQAGTYTIQATYSGDSNYNGATGSTLLTVTASSPVLTWATPAAITYGTPLSSTQLNATSGGIAGTFAYTPAAGAVLPAGTQTLSVTFTPTDSSDYSTQTATVTLVVNKALLSVTPTNASKTYGTVNPAFTGSIVGLVNGDTITATYASGATTSTVVGVYSTGVNAIGATLSDPGNKLPNYNLTQNLGTLTITQATTTLTWATPVPITYGMPLSATQLDATSGGVAGTFAYTPAAGTALPAGSQLLSVTFTPTDGADYSTANTTVTLTVNKAPLTVAPSPASKVYGAANPAFTGSITGLVAGDTVTATYASGATTTTPVGVYSSGVDAIAATLSDPGNKLGNYTLTQNVGTLTITQATTVLAWANPAPITYGTSLSSTQLDATSGGVAGTFAYTPTAGTVLGAGSHTLNVTFTPTDGVDYGPASASVTLTANPATLTVTPNPASKIYGTANPVFSGSITGMIPGDGITATYASAATTSTTVGVYSSGPDAIAAMLSDPGNKLGNYTVNQSLGTLTITQATTVLTWATPAPITYGTPLSATQLDATSGGVVGTFIYTPTSGAILPAGTQILSLAFTPSDTVDYSSANTTTSLTINKATPTVTLTSSTNPTVYGSPVTFTAQTAVSATGTITLYDGATIIGTGSLSSGTATFISNSLGAGTHNITASYGGDSNYLSAVSAAVSQVVTKSPVNITVTSSQNPSNYGQSVTFTFTVTGVSGLALPSGSIAFSDGSTPLASPTLNGSGVATYTTVMLTDGSHSLTAVYGGDTNYQ